MSFAEKLSRLILLIESGGKMSDNEKFVETGTTTPMESAPSDAQTFFSDGIQGATLSAHIDDNVHQIIPGNSSAQTPKKVYGGGSGGGIMEPVVPLKDYVDAQDNAIESRLSSKLDLLPTKGTVWGAAGTVLGLLLAALALAGDRFDGGVGASSLLQEQAEKQAATDAAQDAQLKLMDDKLDILIRQTAEE